MVHTLLSLATFLSRGCFVVELHHVEWQNFNFLDHYVGHENILWQSTFHSLSMCSVTRAVSFHSVPMAMARVEFWSKNKLMKDFSLILPNIHVYLPYIYSNMLCCSTKLKCK